MKIPLTLQILLITVGLTSFYMMVGQAVPQKEVHPPEVIELADDLSTAEMVEIGKEIFDGKGICVTCHNGSARFPDLVGIATLASSRIPGYTALDYFAESLYEPDVFIVDGYTKGMPAINKPPIGLTDDEILAVIAYLQTLGGQATVTMDTLTVYTGGTLGGGEAAGGESAAGAEAVAVAAAAEAPASPLATYGCASCHDGSQAVSLDGISGRMDRSQLLLAIAGHAAGGNAENVTVAQAQTLADFLSQ